VIGQYLTVTGNILLLLLYLVCTTNQKSSLFKSPSSAVSASSGYSFVYWSLTAEKVDGVGGKRSGDTTVYVWTLLEAFSNIFLRSTSFIDKCLSGKKQNFCSWHHFHQKLDYWYF
jgi:hypothetical protein